VEHLRLLTANNLSQIYCGPEQTTKARTTTWMGLNSDSSCLDNAFEAPPFLEREHANLNAVVPQFRQDTSEVCLCSTDFKLANNNENKGFRPRRNDGFGHTGMVANR